MRGKGSMDAAGRGRRRPGRQFPSPPWEIKIGKKIKSEGN